MFVTAGYATVPNSYRVANNKAIDSKIIGGHDAYPGDDPHMCSLRLDNEHSCGASIIGSQWVVTAAHCIYATEPARLSLRCGTLLREGPGLNFTINSTVCHEKFNYDTKDYDIGLIQVVGDIPIGSGVMDTIGLPPQDLDIVPAGIMTTVTGWGYMSNAGELANKLQTLDLPMVDRTTCITDYRDGGFVITDYMFCAGDEVNNKDTCNYDSGGPLKYKNTLVGIVSWGMGCSVPHYPVIICLIAGYGAVPAVRTRVGIIGGTDAKPGDNPHMCSLRIDGGHQCGASIIGTQWVVTAAHCVAEGGLVKPTQLLLRCGTLLREKPGQVLPHEKYDRAKTDYDIALLKVVGEIKLGTPTMDKIALPAQDIDLAPDGAMTTVTGWGLNGAGVLPEKLQTLDIPVVDRATCIKDYSKSSISDFMFCAGYDEGKRDSCSADSGGPLKYKNTLVGVVSWGAGCAEPHHPGIKHIIIICLIAVYGALPAVRNPYRVANNVRTRVGIISGIDAKPGDNPHMCSLRINGSHQCGASIIGSQWVVTAAHCLVLLDVKPTELLLRCGTLLREQPGTDFNISQIISHEKYDDPNYDIALLKVVGEIKLGTSAIDKIALPSQDVDLAPAGAITTVTGWGQNATGYLSEKLQTLDGPVVDRETCINDYKDFDANGVYRISDYMFCAGYDDGKNNSCHALCHGAQETAPNLTIQAFIHGLEIIICLMVCCGAVSARVLTRVGIIGGTDAKPGDNPHMCSLRFNGTHQCGASIIGNQWVVTAGHCVV
ncbi:unnamed protein product, partial [Medioppia subpectinata]